MIFWISEYCPNVSLVIICIYISSYFGFQYNSWKNNQPSLSILESVLGVVVFGGGGVLEPFYAYLYHIYNT